MASKNKSFKIAAKKLGTKLSPYYLVKRAKQREAIRKLVASLRPHKAGFDLIRIGDQGDGGYLVPNDLKGIRHCFSPGVNNLVSFEKYLSNVYGIKSFLCDYAVERPVCDFDFEFDKKFVGAYNDEVYFTLQSWYEKYLGKEIDSELLLQMDIEGAEYPTILSTPEALLKSFRIVVVEFHHLFKLLDYTMFPIIEATFNRLLSTHLVVHIHPNNNQGVIGIEGLDIPDVMEFTFLRRDRAQSISPAIEFPHPLDVDVDSERRSIVLPKCWWSM